MADRIRHGQDGETKSQRDANQTDAEIDRCGAFRGKELPGQHRTATAAKVSQKVPKNSARILFFMRFVWLLFGFEQELAEETEFQIRSLFSPFPPVAYLPFKYFVVVTPTESFELERCRVEIVERHGLSGRSRCRRSHCR